MMKSKKRLSCILAVFLAIVLLIPPNAARAVPEFVIPVQGDDTHTNLHVQRFDGKWYVDADSLAILSGCQIVTNASTGLLSFYRLSREVILLSLQKDAYKTANGKAYVPLAETAVSLGLEFRPEQGTWGWHVLSFKTPVELKADLNRIFSKNEYHLWEVIADLDWTWTTAEYMAVVWSVLPVGKGSFFGQVLGLENKERYEKAVSAVLTSSGDVLDLIGEMIDLDHNLKDASKAIARSEKYLNKVWEYIENDQALSQKLIDADAYEFVRNVYSTDIGYYDGLEEYTFFRDYAKVSNAMQVDYWFPKLAFLAMATDGKAAEITALYKVFGNSSDPYLKDAATRLMSIMAEDDKGAAKALGDVYGGYALHWAADLLDEALEETLGGSSSPLWKIVYRVEVKALETVLHSPDLNDVSDAILYYTIFSAMSMELSDYYYKHRDDELPDTLTDLRAVALLYLNTAKACVDECSFDEGLNTAAERMEGELVRDYLTLMEYGDKEFAPDYTNQGFVKWLDNNYPEVPAGQEGTEQAGTVQPAVDDGEYFEALCRIGYSSNELVVYLTPYVRPGDWWGERVDWHTAQYCYENQVKNTFVMYDRYDPYIGAYRTYQYVITDIEKEANGYRFYYVYYSDGSPETGDFFIDDDRDCISVYQMMTLPISPACRYLDVDYEGAVLSKEEFWNSFHMTHYGDLSYVDITVSGGVIVEMQISFFQ